jgi:hypothetical protein
MISMDKVMLYKRYVVFRAPNSELFAIDTNFNRLHQSALYLWEMQDIGKCDTVNSRVKITGVDEV